MEISKKLSGKNVAIAAGLIVLFVVAFVLVLRAYRQEGERRAAVISESGERDPSHVEVFVKLVSVDPIKGDASARLDFVPHGDLTPDNGNTLSRDIKLLVNSATGKQEHVFEKSKRMNPVDVTMNLYDGTVTDYPFDHHKAYLEMYLEGVRGKDEKSKAGAAPPAAPAPTPAPQGEEDDEEGPQRQHAQAAPQAEAAAEEEASIPIGVDFFGSIPGLNIKAEKTSQTDEDLVGIDMEFERASTVKFFSIFVMVVMWGVTIVVLLMTFSIVMRGRKIEVGMFSFLAALLFAFVTVRNAQPGSPPIGSYSDYLSFFWAEIIIALCLLSIVAVWVYRPAAK
ncbi:MAG TPA: DUF4436 family protein [Pyrinomonadaceae bacterium]|nr:DUF4436 family protein [Pyrinomonadaceae bacterium]